MSYQFNLDSPNSLIILTYSGDVAYPERLQAAADLSQLVTQQNNDNLGLLVDCRELNSKMSAEEEKFAVFIASDKILRTIKKVALVHQADNNPTPYIQCHAYVNGLNLVPFYSVYEAKSWLTGALP